MKPEFRKELEDWGVNFAEANERFMGNEEMLEKFLKKFLTDPNMEALENALNASDAKEAFKACHALKGVAGNLSLEGFRGQVMDLTEILRADRLDGTKELFDAIKPKYDALIAILSKYE